VNIIEQIANFEADMAADTTLSPVDRTQLKDKFFAQKIRSAPEWHDAPPDLRFKVAKKFGISPGLAQAFEGEFFVRGGKPVTGEFGEGTFETGALPMPKGDIGQTVPTEEAGILPAMLDPTIGLTGGVAGLAAKAPMIGSMLAARNPLFRAAARQGVLGSALDWQTMGLHRLPGFIGRKAGDVMQRFGGQAPTGQMGRSGPASGAPPPMFSGSASAPTPKGPMKALPARTPPPQGPFPMPSGLPPQPPSGPFPSSEWYLPGGRLVR
jgi:hypothetical protein